MYMHKFTSNPKHAQYLYIIAIDREKVIYQQILFIVNEP